MNIKDIYMNMRINSLGYYNRDENICYVNPKKVIRKHLGKEEYGYDIVIPQDIQNYNKNLDNPIKFVFQSEKFVDIRNVIFTGEIEFYNCTFSGDSTRIKPYCRSKKEKLSLKKCIFDTKKLELIVDDISLYKNLYNTDELDIKTIDLEINGDSIDSPTTNLNVDIDFNSKYVEFNNCSYNLNSLNIKNINSKYNYLTIANCNIEANDIDINDKHNLYIKNSDICIDYGFINSVDLTIDDFSNLNGDRLSVHSTKVYKGLDRENINFEKLYLNDKQIMSVSNNKQLIKK